MPITLSYDLRDATPNQRSYVRSMFERFGWKRLGGSVFRYKGREVDGELYEDWLNDVAPALMYLRSYVLSIGASFKFLTIDSMGSSMLDHSGEEPVGNQAEDEEDLFLRTPTNVQSSEERIRSFVENAVGASTEGL